MGVDARPGEPIDISTRPDALMVLHLNATRGTCRILSIPRDTRTELPGYGQSKVNHALVVGGIPYQKLVVANLLGLEIDRYALIDFAGFAAFVDAIGGVTINVPEAFTASDGTVFEAGPQRFDGQTALAYARYRGGPDRDLGRIRNQHQLIGALLRASAGRDIVRDVNEILPALKAHIRTDLRPAELIDLARQYRSTCTAESIRLFSLSGTVSKFDDPLLRRPLDYFVVTDAEIRQKVAELSAT
jgi:LCP family protein required for cell wall assembly